MRGRRRRGRGVCGVGAVVCMKWTVVRWYACVSGSMEDGGLKMVAVSVGKDGCSGDVEVSCGVRGQVCGEGRR